MGWLKIYKNEHLVWVKEEGVRDTRYFDHFDFEIDDTTVYLRCHYKEYSKDYKVLFADFQNEAGVVVGGIPEIEAYLEAISKTKVDVSIQDSTSPLLVVPVMRLDGEVTLTVDAVVDERTVTVSDGTNILTGREYRIVIYNPSLNEVSYFVVLSKNVNVLTLDTPIDIAYPSGSIVSYGRINMNVDGSVTPQIFGVRNPTSSEIEVSVDFTRMMITFELTSSGDFSKFGNIAGGLVNGLVCRKTDGIYHNIFNAKTNLALASIMYDLTFISAIGAAPDGIRGRFTFGALGSVVRLAPFEDLQFIVQDDLTLLTKFGITVEGGGVTF